MKIIDDVTYNALLNCREKYETNAAMAAAFGVSRAYMGKLLRRRVSHFDDETWDRISAFLKPYIVPSPHCGNCADCPHAADCLFREIIENLLAVPRDRQEEWFRAVNTQISNLRPDYL